jgi:hypothetical protein
MEEGMKITMLGHSDAGKTTYMASMYAIMNAQHRSSRGFGIVALNAVDHEALLHLGNRIATSGDYPSPTDVRSEYAFSLTLNGKPMVPFTWVDYRGGALYDRTGGDSELDALSNDLRSSDAVLVFMDASKLVEPDSDGPDIGRLAVVLGKISSKDLPPPVALVVSKIDALLPPPEAPPSSGFASLALMAAVALTLYALAVNGAMSFGLAAGCWLLGLGALAHRSSVITEQKARRQAALEALIQRAKLPIEGLIGTIASSSDLQGALIATGCSAREMLNVDKPVLFSLFYGIATRIARLRALIEALDSQAHYHAQKSSLWNSFTSWLNDKTSDAEYARRARESAEGERQRMQALIPAAQALHPSITGFAIF